MRSTDLGAEYETLAHLIGKSFACAPRAICLYAEIEPDWVAPSLFADVGDHVLYSRVDDDIIDQLFEIWDQLEEDDRWQVIECKLEDGNFEANFRFADSLDPKEHVDERRPRFLNAMFGDKRVVYPPWDDDES